FLKNARFRRIIAGVDHDDALPGDDRHGVGVVALADEGVDAVRQPLEFGALTGDGMRRARCHNECQQDEDLQTSHDRASRLGVSRPRYILRQPHDREESRMTDDERAIRELVATWMSASKAGDTETVLSLIADDAVFTVVG